LKKPDGEDRKIQVPSWIDPAAQNGTPMCRALDLATSVLKRWVVEHSNSFPPIVFNITDGEATDGDPLRFSQELRKISTDDGETLLFNIHLSESQNEVVFLPDDLPSLEDEYAETLFHMSSLLPFPLRSTAMSEGIDVNDNTKGYVYNSDPYALIRFLEIGTRPSVLR